MLEMGRQSSGVQSKFRRHSDVLLAQVKEIKAKAEAKEREKISGISRHPLTTGATMTEEGVAGLTSGINAIVVLIVVALLVGATIMITIAEMLIGTETETGTTTVEMIAGTSIAAITMTDVMMTATVEILTTETDGTTDERIGTSAVKSGQREMVQKCGQRSANWSTSCRWLESIAQELQKKNNVQSRRNLLPRQRQTKLWGKQAQSTELLKVLAKKLKQQRRKPSKQSPRCRPFVRRPTNGAGNWVAFSLRWPALRNFTNVWSQKRGN
jgi:hypothetical protein